MSASTAAGLLLILLPLAFNACFALLAARFDYPDVLRLPTGEVLERFRAGGTGLILLWWAFAMTAVLLAPAVVLFSTSLAGADGHLQIVAAFIGILAATVQFLGLIRWPFLVPYLAREAEAAKGDANREAAVDIVFQSFNRYLGVAVGEHLGYLLTGAWTVLAGIAMTQSSATPGWLGIIGVAIGAALATCAFEFVGAFEDRGWPVAEKLTPIAYVAWSVWLVASGIAVL
jgi:hypothetical protein